MSEDPAKQRLMVINVMRLAGAALAIFGLLIITARINLPVEVGYFLFFLGVIDGFFVPPLLARRWRSPPL